MSESNDISEAVRQLVASVEERDQKLTECQNPFHELETELESTKQRNGRQIESVDELNLKIKSEESLKQELIEENQSLKQQLSDPSFAPPPIKTMEKTFKFSFTTPCMVCGSRISRYPSGNLGLCHWHKYKLYKRDRKHSPRMRDGFDKYGNQLEKQ